MAVLTEGTLGDYLHFLIRDALDAVLIYDGENILFVFCRGLWRGTQHDNVIARIEPGSRSKLKGDTHRSILEKTFNNMQELVQQFAKLKNG